MLPHKCGTFAFQETAQAGHRTEKEFAPSHLKQAMKPTWTSPENIS
jgi:hypothetical protein